MSAPAIPPERQAEAAVIIGKFLEDFNEALLGIPAEQAVSRDFAVFLGTAVSITEGATIKDQEMALELLKALNALEKRIIALEQRAGT